MTSLAPIIIPTIAVIVTVFSLAGVLSEYLLRRRAEYMAAHWRNRAIDLSAQITEQQRLRSERTAKGNRTRAAKRRGE